MVKLKNLLLEKTVRLSTMKDASFEPGQFVQILGKKGKVKLDKKSVKYLAKWIRQNSGKHGMGWSFTEGKLTEDFKNNEWEVYVADENRKEKIVKVAKSKRAAVILYNKLIKTDKYHEVGMRVIKEGKLNEGKTLTLPNGVKAIIDFKGIKFKARKGAPVFLDRDELLKFFRGSTKYLRYT